MIRYAIVTTRQSKNIQDQDVFQIEGAYTNFIYQFNLQPLGVSNRICIKAIGYLQPSLILLTGGGDIPTEYYDSPVVVTPQPCRDSIEIMLIDFAIRNKVPLLGICRGMQMINGFFGGKVTRNNTTTHPVSIMHTIRDVSNNEEFEVNSYHRDIIQKTSLSKAFREVMLHKEFPHIEAYTSDKHRILGLQWHPERLDRKCNGSIISTILVKNLIEGVRS